MTVDIQQRIAGMLWRHLPVPGESRCLCGEWSTAVEPWNEHVAGALVSELGLTRETYTKSCNCKTVPFRPHRQGENGCTASPDTVSRYVTEWLSDA